MKTVKDVKATLNPPLELFSGADKATRKQTHRVVWDAIHRNTDNTNADTAFDDTCKAVGIVISDAAYWGATLAIRNATEEIE